MSGPLDGIRVLDLTMNVMGPLAAQILGDMGADVVKVEPPEGDPMRVVGIKGAEPVLASQFIHLNRNKRSLVLGLKAEVARPVIRRLIERADVLVSSQRPQAMTRLGLAYDAVAAINPRIVYASAFGYGQDGPYAAKPAYDDLIQAALGMPVLQAPAGEAPRYMATNIVDRACGREVAVVGSGDAAAQEALHLAGIAAKVVMLARAERLRARESYVHRIAAEPRIEVRLGVDVIGVEGGDAVAGLRIRGRADGREQHLPTSALFVFIGLEPATAWLPASLARDTGGAIITDDRLLTALPRVLAVGACRSGYSGRLDDAIDEARRAVDAALRRPV